MYQEQIPLNYLGRNIIEGHGKATYPIFLYIFLYVGFGGFGMSFSWVQDLSMYVNLCVHDI